MRQRTDVIKGGLWVYDAGSGPLWKTNLTVWQKVTRISRRRAPLHYFVNEQKTCCVLVPFVLLCEEWVTGNIEYFTWMDMRVWWHSFYFRHVLVRCFVPRTVFVLGFVWNEKMFFVLSHNLSVFTPKTIQILWVILSWQVTNILTHSYAFVFKNS